MNLISCDNCGVVLDKDKLVFPDIWKNEEDGSVINTKVAEWTGEEYVSTLPCPVCKARILGDVT